MGTYAYGIGAITIAPDGRRIGLLDYVGKGNPTSASYTADLDRARTLARKLTRATCAAAGLSYPPALVTFRSSWNLGGRILLYAWGMRRLAYVDGAGPPGRAAGELTLPRPA